MILREHGYDFGFDGSKCAECGGNCCIGESGYIWITIDEIEKLASFLKIPVERVFERYLQKFGYRFSIKENQLSEENYACVFFDIEQKKCTIYDVRPSQCRSFPFWEHFKTNQNEVKEECPAIIEL